MCFIGGRRRERSRLGWRSCLDEGKPDWLVELQREGGMAEQFPKVIRPDLMLAKGRFAVTELDSVPGGMGITAWLSRTYAEAGYDVLGGADGMIEGFRSLMPEGGDILVSEESADYLPEMDWLAGELGDAWKTALAENFEAGSRAIYRFFELFDWESMPYFRRMAERSAKGEISVTPPFKPHLEDKLWLALFWSPGVEKAVGAIAAGQSSPAAQAADSLWLGDGSRASASACCPAKAQRPFMGGGRGIFPERTATGA